MNLHYLLNLDLEIIGIMLVKVFYVSHWSRIYKLQDASKTLKVS